VTRLTGELEGVVMAMAKAAASGATGGGGKATDGGTGGVTEGNLGPVRARAPARGHTGADGGATCRRGHGFFVPMGRRGGSLEFSRVRGVWRRASTP